MDESLEIIQRLSDALYNTYPNVRQQLLFCQYVLNYIMQRFDYRAHSVDTQDIDDIAMNLTRSFFDLEHPLRLWWPILSLELDHTGYCWYPRRRRIENALRDLMRHILDSNPMWDGWNAEEEHTMATDHHDELEVRSLPGYLEDREGRTGDTVCVSSGVEVPDPCVWCNAHRCHHVSVPLPTTRWERSPRDTTRSRSVDTMLHAVEGTLHTRRSRGLIRNLQIFHDSHSQQTAQRLEVMDVERQARQEAKRTRRNAVDEYHGTYHDHANLREARALEIAAVRSAAGGPNNRQVVDAAENARGTEEDDLYALSDSESERARRRIPSLVLTDLHDSDEEVDFEDDSLDADDSDAEEFEDDSFDAASADHEDVEAGLGGSPDGNVEAVSTIADDLSNMDLDSGDAQEHYDGHASEAGAHNQGGCEDSRTETSDTGRSTNAATDFSHPNACQMCGVQIADPFARQDHYLSHSAFRD